MNLESSLTKKFWSAAVVDLYSDLGTTEAGLTGAEAQARVAQYGSQHLKKSQGMETFKRFLGQVATPISLLLIFSACLSFGLGDRLDASIILAIILLSALLSFWQEHGASAALEKLLAIVRINANIIRDGVEAKIPADEVVPGDIVMISAGAKIPGDCRILEAHDLFINEAALTGETFPVEKSAGQLAEDAGLSQRVNCLYFGTNAVSGTAKALVVATGNTTEFAKIAVRLRLRPPETDFEQGIRRFGGFLVQVTILLVAGIFAANVFYHRPLLESLMFSLALAAGLTPQLLPAIISVNLAQGAKMMAKQSVIVRRLASIENFGSMDILCSDKTGTITEGVVQLHSMVGLDGNASEKVPLYAYLNAFFETGFSNPIDEAIRTHQVFDVKEYQKIDEIPYDFIRKRLSVLVTHQAQRILITKGAVDNVLSVCSHAESSTGSVVDIAGVRARLGQMFGEFSQKGYRTLALAYRKMEGEQPLVKGDEVNLIFLGFLVLYDPIKPDVKEVIDHLKSLGVSLKMITGDNHGVALEVARQIFSDEPTIITGGELRIMSDDALVKRVSAANIFAEVEPNQKERIILALKKAGHVVGYMGDGINDASALHVADVGISVNDAVDVAKEAADIVLLKQDLGVLAHGVRYGRITFANTMKYVFMATSANFGNMFSMAGASLFLPFLPLLPKQILLTNLLTDLPEMAIATDSVDEELISKPQRWNIRFIRSFMFTFGSISSFFDFLTFGVLLSLNFTQEQFRTGWFIESVVSAALVVLVIRTPNPIWQARPSRYLFWGTMMTIAITLILPYTPLAEMLGLAPLNFSTMMILLGIVALYIITAEIAKRFFYHKINWSRHDILKPIFEHRRHTHLPHIVG